MDKFTEATIATYDRTFEQYSKNVANLHHSEVAGTFLENLSANNSILDLGCGSGRDAKIFSEKGYRVVGVDLSYKMLEVARKEAPLASFIQLDMRELTFNNETFGGVWAVASLLHLPKTDISQCLNECNRVLKKEGIIYISVKVGEGKEFKPDTRYDENAFKFYSYFQSEEMENYIQQAGFKILESKTKDCFKHYLQHNEIRVFGIKK